MTQPTCAECRNGDKPNVEAEYKVRFPNDRWSTSAPPITEWVCNDHYTMLADDYDAELEVIWPKVESKCEHQGTGRNANGRDLCSKCNMWFKKGTIEAKEKEMTEQGKTEATAKATDRLEEYDIDLNPEATPDSEMAELRSKMDVLRTERTPSVQLSSKQRDWVVDEQMTGMHDDGSDPDYTALWNQLQEGKEVSGKQALIGLWYIATGAINRAEFGDHDDASRRDKGFGQRILEKIGMDPQQIREETQNCSICHNPLGANHACLEEDDIESDARKALKAKGFAQSTPDMSNAHMDGDRPAVEAEQFDSSRDESGLLLDTQIDLRNARNEMKAIQSLVTSQWKKTGNEALNKTLYTIGAYAENELHRLDRLEEDIKKLNNKV